MTDKFFDEKKLEREVKDARDKMDKGLRDARDRIGEKYDETAKMVGEREEQVAEKIRERPLTWVAGAFLAGMVISKLLSRRD
ncbi:MAG: hypothetical protein WAX07_05210 [Candidatus Altiarchaeia archaeon]